MNLTRTATGTWSGGRFMHFGEQLSEERLANLLRLSHEKGVNTFVTADVYGTGRADQLLGQALDGIDRDSYCLVGMIGHDIHHGSREGAKGYQRFTDPRLRDKSGYADYVKMATEKSLSSCRASKFDLVMLHNPDEIGYTEPAVWDAMETLKSAGLADRIGIAPGPANGFVMDLIHCFQNFGDRIDWAMLILNPLEPWPQKHVLPIAAEKNIDVLTRVVDYGGMFHDIMRPGHSFKDGDHRAYRPDGWIDHAYPKIERFREIAAGHGLSLLQFACQWNLAQLPVKSVVPTLIQEPGAPKSIEDELNELAQLPVENLLTAEDLAEIEKLGDNTGCMKLKGASERHTSDDEPRPDTWPVRPELLEIASRFALNPAW